MRNLCRLFALTMYSNQQLIEFYFYLLRWSSCREVMHMEKKGNQTPSQFSGLMQRGGLFKYTPYRVFFHTSLHVADKYNCGPPELITPSYITWEFHSSTPVDTDGSATHIFSFSTAFSSVGCGLWLREKVTFIESIIYQSKDLSDSVATEQLELLPAWRSGANKNNNKVN